MRILMTISMAALMAALSGGVLASDKDKDLIPPEFSKLQRENMIRFLEKHDRPTRYVPADAKLVDAEPGAIDVNAAPPAGQSIKQYMVQITPYRAVPGQEEVKRAEVYYYRPNPEKGKPGITVRHTVDLATGEQVGQTEVLVKRHTPISRDELTEAVELAGEKSEAVKQLYKNRPKNAVKWEYLQLMISRKQEPNEPGDRVVRLVYTATAPEGESPPTPVRVIVNLTKGVVLADER